jgi:ATP-dependent DNA ligase
VEPRLVVMIEYREWTPAGRLRAPVYQGLVDAASESITREAEHPET